MLNLRLYGTLLAAVISCAGLATGCDDDDGDDIEDGDDAADLANAEGEDMGEALVDQADAELAGVVPEVAVSRIGAILLAIDIGEISHAQVELDLGADPVVLDFAARILEEHSLHDELVDDLLDVRRLVATEGGVSTELRAEAEAGIDVLTRESRVSIDFTYLQLELEMHVAAELLVDGLIDHAPDAVLEDFLIATRDAIAVHRDEAEDLLRGW